MAILNKEKCHFFFTKAENRRAEQVLPEEVRTSVGGGGKRVYEGEYSANTVYIYM
jgi:hypothetical protein